MIDGVDLSRYDSAWQDDTSAVDEPRATFVILNCDDPGVGSKAHRAHDIGKLWGLYTWLYAGRGADSVTRGQAVADLLELDGLPQPPLGIWIDYEDNGVSVGDVWAALGVRGVVKTRLGFYTYLYLLNSQDGLRAAWAAFEGRWLAYYPTGDENYPAWAIGDAQANEALLWQYTSSGGTRDRDAVVDEAAWGRWAQTSVPTPAPVHQEDDDDMASIRLFKQGGHDFGVWVEGDKLVYRSIGGFGVPGLAVAIPSRDPKHPYSVAPDAVPTVDGSGRVIAPGRDAGTWVVATPTDFGYVAQVL